jgi:transposase-like protein
MRGKKMFGRGRFGGGMIFKTEVVNGVCPTCTTDSIFISICPSMYRCTNCGSDLEQKINGVIQYIPAATPGGKIPVLQTIEDGPQKA